MRLLFTILFFADPSFEAPKDKIVDVSLIVNRVSHTDSIIFSCVDANEWAIGLLRYRGIDTEGYRVMEIIQGEQ